jgi:hypothetical protein
MPTKKFGGGSVASLQDFYDNKTVDSTELKANLGELFESKTPGPKRDSKLFHFGVKTKVGAVSRNGPISQLRLIASYLEKLPEDKRVMFKIEVWEDPIEGKR